MKPKYCFVLPKKLMSEVTNTESKLNDENPMYRVRNAKQFEPQEEDNVLNQKSIYPSSYLPDFFFTNTVSQPFLIFYNLNKIFEKTANDQKYAESKEEEKSIIHQLNELFGVNVLSFSQLKVDLNQVFDTWNKRFPYSKSSTINPIHDDFKVTDIPDLQSLHLLGFSLNIGIYLLFYIDDNNNNKVLYNMKLGPDNSDNDVHFQSFVNVDKKIIFDDEECGKVYKQEKWLSFQRIEVGKVLNFESKFIPFDSKNNLMYLEMERRDPIPIIKLPDFEENEFKEIALFQKKINRTTMPNISFRTFSKNNQSKEKLKNLCIEITISNSDQFRMFNKLNSLVTKLNVKLESKKKKIKIENEDMSLIAETNDSAFLVKKTEINQQQEMENYTFKIGKNIEKDQIEKGIISFNDRVKIPYTYSYLIDEETGKGKHPLINLLCVHHLADVMILSTEAIDNRLSINRESFEGIKLRLVPIENDNDVYYTFRKFDEDKSNWKKITENYPSILSIGANHSYDKSYSKKTYNKDETILFQDFFYYVTRMKSDFVKEFKKLRLRSKKLIDYYMKSDVGLNPIFCPVIFKEFNELSKASCISFYSEEQYDKPLNNILLRDVQSVKEVISRTTTNLFDVEEVNENVRRGNFPVKIQSLLTRIKMKGNQRIPDPSFAFAKSFSFLAEEDERKLEDLRKPEYEYKFYYSFNGKIVNTSKFVISSQYEISYLYVSQNNVFSIAQLDNDKFAYGHCNTIDTEMVFYNFHIGQFKAAIYMENKKCLIIAYQRKDNKSKSILFTGYDKQGQIIDVDFNIFDEKIDFKFDSIAVISRSYFAAQFTVKRVEKISPSISKSRKTEKENDQYNYDYSVFKYDSQKRTIVKCNYNDLWKVKENNLCKAFLKEKATNPMCFIGSKLDTSYNNSTLCIYKYENGNLDPIYSNEVPSSSEDASFDFNFVLDEDENDEIMDYENRLLENRIRERNSRKKSKNKKNIMIHSMLNCVCTENKEKFSVFDFYCSLCELFPSPLVINNRLVCCSNGSLSFYLCDYKIYRLISHQISCFFINMFQRMSLFTTEMLLCRYNFKKIQIAIIVDTCGIGARLSNLVFGTRFDETQIIDNEIWSGFSYSEDSAFIILLFHVKDSENVYNAIQARKQIRDDNFKNSFIFVCSNDGAKYTIKFGTNPKSVCTTASSEAADVKRLILFVNNNELEDKVLDLYDLIHNNEHEFYDNSKTALVFAKEIVTQYLSFVVFVNYPHKTIEKYSLNIFDNAENTKKDGSDAENTKKDGNDAENTKKDGNDAENTKKDGNDAENTKKDGKDAKNVKLDYFLINYI